MPITAMGTEQGHHWRNDMLTNHWVEALAAIVALGLFVYLGNALLRPEKF